jgi:hypothetical protein
MRAFMVNQQAQRGFACAARMQGAQKRVFYPHHRRAALFSDAKATMGSGRIAPDCHCVPVTRQTQMQGIPRQLKEASDAPLGHEPAVVNEKPPDLFRTGDGGIVYFRP